MGVEEVAVDKCWPPHGDAKVLWGVLNPWCSRRKMFVFPRAGWLSSNHSGKLVGQAEKEPVLVLLLILLNCIVKRNTWDIAFVPIKDAQGNVSLLGYWSWNWYVCTTGGKYLAVMTRMELPPKSARKIKGQSSETWHPSVVLGE